MSADRASAPSSGAGGEDREWQRLDKWLWCARFMKARADCARLVSGGGVRINRQPTDKPHAKLRPGDVLTLPAVGAGDVRVIRVLSLAPRRGPVAEARALYDEAPEGRPCNKPETLAHGRPAQGRLGELR